jgi:NADPH-dependent ferric siderophore reductase
MSLDQAIRRIERVRHESRLREARLARTSRISPHFLSATFTGEDLHDFSSQGFDDHVKLIIEAATGAEVIRDYTPRRFDRERLELDIEFYLHGEGAASSWVREAKLGASVLIGGPKNSMVIPTDYAWHLLIGDDTALPAIERRLEELPVDTRVLVIAQLSDFADRRGFDPACHLDLQWLEPSDDLLAHVRMLTLPAGEGFVWAAGEGGTMTQVRDVLLSEKQHPLAAMRVASYWKPGAMKAHEVLTS